VWLPARRCVSSEHASLTHSLTPWSRVLLDKLTGFQLVKKFPAFYETRMFITAFTSSHHLSLSCHLYPVHTSLHPTSWRSILILSSHLCRVLSCGLIPSVFPHKNPVYASPLPHTRYMPRLSHFSRFYHPNNIGWGVLIIQLLMQLPPLPCYLVPPRSKYSPQHPILKHPQPTFLPQYQWPSFTPIQNNRQNKILYILIFKFLDGKLEDKRFFTE